MGQTDSTLRPRDRDGDVSSLREGEAFRRADDKLFNAMLDKRIERIMSRNATVKSDATVEQQGVSMEIPPTRVGATTFHALPLEIRREIMSYLAQERRKEPLYPDQTCTASEPMGSSGLVKQRQTPRDTRCKRPTQPSLWKQTSTFGAGTPYLGQIDSFGKI